MVDIKLWIDRGGRYSFVYCQLRWNDYGNR